MTSTETRPLLVDAQRWPDVAAVPHAPLRAAVAEALVRRLAARLPLRVAFPDGIVLGHVGGAPVLRLRRPAAFFSRVGVGGLIGFGEAYQAGDWDSDDLPALVQVFAAHAETIVPQRLQWLRRFHGAQHPPDDDNSVDGARRNIHRHYDLSNDLFELFLDPSLTYSSALFGAITPRWSTLTAAQHVKIDRLLDLTGVGPGTRLLEIGTGWGELAIRAARRGASVTSVTLSLEQRDLAVRRVHDAGVADRVRILLRDYREVDGVYDAIVSVEMLEAVGERYWRAYFGRLDRLLAPGGKIGLQTITMRHNRMLASRDTYTWIQKYIFPGGLIPSLEAISAAAMPLSVVDTFTFGPDYAQTLRLWRERFLSQTAEIARLGFDETFRRTWDLYLAYSQAGFAARYLDVAQLLLARTR